MNPCALKDFKQYSCRYLKIFESRIEYDFSLTLFDMAFWKSQPWGGGVPHNFVVVASMIMKFGTNMKLDVFYTMATKNL